MKKTTLLIMSVLLYSIVGAQEKTGQSETYLAKQRPTELKDEDSQQVEKAPALLEEGSTEYWVVRSQAMTEFIPFLTKKRTEVKKTRLLLAEYLLKIGKADEFASRNMPVAYDAEIYADILRIRGAFEAMNMEIPKERPSWNSLVEIVMQHIVFEGYWPTDIEEGAEAEQYIALCKKKEEYGQKVRNDAKSVLDQTAKMWVYLVQIEKLGDFKAYSADLILEAKAARAKEKAMYVEKHRQEAFARTAEKKQQKFDDAQARAQFKSSRRSRAYESRQDRLRYRQSRLDERFVNSRAYYY